MYEEIGNTLDITKVQVSINSKGSVSIVFTDYEGNTYTRATIKHHLKDNTTTTLYVKKD